MGSSKSGKRGLGRTGVADPEVTMFWRKCNYISMALQDLSWLMGSKFEKEAKGLVHQ